MMNFQCLSFTAGLLLILSSIFFQVRDKEKYALSFLILATFCFYIFASSWYPFLNVWDERFHALVAKNLMKHPGMPTLYDDPVLNIPYDNWDRYHIWLHKQPLFLWQIALCFKLFGLNEFALRLPGILLGTSLVWAVYRSGKILGNKQVGYCAAFLLTTSLYLMELISGRQEVDQNDIAFLSYISLSIWCWIEYIHAPKKRWLILLAVFSGFAVLCKWLVGLLVYALWSFYLLFDFKTSRSGRTYLRFGAALLITLCIFLPWQVFIFHRYPSEAKAMMELNFRHLTDAVDGRGGSFWYHFAFIGWLFGAWVPYLILPAFVFAYKNSKNKKLVLALICVICCVYLFFSFAQTKMPSFPVVLVLPIFLCLAFAMDWMARFIQGLRIRTFVQKSILFMGFCGILYMRLDYSTLHDKHGFMNGGKGYGYPLIQNKKIFQSLHLPANAVICNVPGIHYVEAMFYTGLPAYNVVPTESQYTDLCNKRRIIAIFQPLSGELPEYLKKDKNLIVIRERIEEFE
jgi:4-amino-4-deoxy-L-arabinose transferase-like glycosyltransferase